MRKLLPRLDLLLLNEAEARQLSGQEDLLHAGRAILRLGPQHVTIKMGEHGCLLMSPNEIFRCAAFPAEMVKDPTGAGDAFAGGFLGYLSRKKRAPITFHHLKRGALMGSLMASFCVESFSVDRLANLSEIEIAGRFRSFVLRTEGRR